MTLDPPGFPSWETKGSRPPHCLGRSLRSWPRGPFASPSSGTSAQGARLRLVLGGRTSSDPGFRVLGPSRRAGGRWGWWGGVLLSGSLSCTSRWPRSHEMPPGSVFPKLLLDVDKPVIRLSHRDAPVPGDKVSVGRVLLPSGVHTLRGKGNSVESARRQADGLGALTARGWVGLGDAPDPPQCR